MRILAKTFVPVLVALAFPMLVTAQAKQITFPTNEEINMLMTQANRAMEQYRLIVTEEDAFLGSAASEGTAQDKQVIASWDVMSKGFKAKPQAFNSTLGFEFVLTLDDAARNAVLSSNQAATSVSTRMLDGKISDAQSLLQFAQSCTDTSTLLYTVSENASALYQKFLDAEQEAASQAAELLTQCTNILKQQKH